jgi:hypothetical protein
MGYIDIDCDFGEVRIGRLCISWDNGDMIPTKYYDRWWGGFCVVWWARDYDEYTAQPVDVPIEIFSCGGFSDVRSVSF